MEPGKTRKGSSSIQFKQFDIVSDHSGHHYGGAKQSGKDKDTFTNGDSAVHRRIMKEWKILKKGLPETIYVRVYEERIDLLRAVIVGSSGTPYHDGLFFFDIAFPCNYPSSPPKVYYRSHGLRLNPNLYEGGFVCLSLINTWDGNVKEMWDSSASTILQVLVSIQGLVLNEEPYFNEPGYAKSTNQIKKSLNYNEDVFILSCKTMLYILKKPPKHFEDFIRQHFDRRRDAILGAIEAYRDGLVVVGHYQHHDDDDDDDASSKVKVRSQFETDANKLYSKLRQALDKIESTTVVPQKRKLAKKVEEKAKKIKRSTGEYEVENNIVKKKTSNDLKPKVEQKQGIFHKVRLGVLKTILELVKNIVAK